MSATRSTKAASQRAQPLSPDEMKQIVGHLASAKSRQDIDTAMSIYHLDGVLESPSMGSRHEGAESLRRALESFFAFAPDYSVELAGQAADGETLCSWGAIRLTPQYSFRGETPDGRLATTQVFMLFRFRDRRIVWESFYFDAADVPRQTGVSADAYRRP